MCGSRIGLLLLPSPSSAEGPPALGGGGGGGELLEKFFVLVQEDTPERTVVSAGAQDCSGLQAPSLCVSDARVRRDIIVAIVVYLNTISGLVATVFLFELLDIDSYLLLIAPIIAMY